MSKQPPRLLLILSLPFMGSEAPRKDLSINKMWLFDTCPGVVRRLGKREREKGGKDGETQGLVKKDPGIAANPTAALL